jgi:hypothetical protein
MKSSILWDIKLCSMLKDNRLCLPPAFTLVSCSAYSSTLKMEAFLRNVMWLSTDYTVLYPRRTLHNHAARTSKPTREYITSAATGKCLSSSSQATGCTLSFYRFLLGWLRSHSQTWYHYFSDIQLFYLLMPCVLSITDGRSHDTSLGTVLISSSRFAKTLLPKYAQVESPFILPSL